MNVEPPPTPSEESPCVTETTMRTSPTAVMATQIRPFSMSSESFPLPFFGSSSPHPAPGFRERNRENRDEEKVLFEVR